MFISIIIQEISALVGVLFNKKQEKRKSVIKEKFGIFV